MAVQNLHEAAAVLGSIHSTIVQLFRETDALEASVHDAWKRSDKSDEAMSTIWTETGFSEFCTWLVEERHLGANPCNGVPRPREPRRLPRALRVEQVAAILRACPDVRAELLVMLMVQQGLRRAEVARLQVGDIDLTDATMRVFGKGGHERYLPLAAECLRAIEAYLVEYPAALGPLVRSYQFERGLHPDTVSAIVRRAMQDAGVKRAPLDRVSAHALRHTMATDTLRSGAHLRDVQHLLGHKHLSTTETYLPLIVNDLREAIGRRRYRPATGLTCPDPDT